MGRGKENAQFLLWLSVMTLVWRSCTGGYQISAVIRSLRGGQVSGFAQALTRPPGFDRARLLYAKGFRAGGCGGLFPHSNGREYGRSNLTMITMRVYHLASPSAIVVPEAPYLAMCVSCTRERS